MCFKILIFKEKKKDNTSFMRYIWNKILYMAFVYRKQKQEPQSIVTQTPGPGQYNGHTQITNTNSAVGFANRVQRKLWQASSTPGPGQYNLKGNCKQQLTGFNTLVSNQNLEFYVIDTINNKDGYTSMFKSESKKLSHVINDNPGPGHYQISSEKPRRNLSTFSRERSTKLSRYLYSESKRQFQNMESIQVNRNKDLIHQSPPQNENAGIYEQQSKYNYNSVFNSKVQRKFVSRPQTSNGVGPGTYDIQQVYRNCDRKSFNYKSNNVPKNQPAEPSKVISAKIIEKISNTENVGPGSYQVQSSSFKRPYSSQSRGISCFGSKQSRFQRNIYSHNATPGPQSYFTKKVQTVQKDESAKKIGFNSCANKTSQFFYIVPSTKFTQVSPCSYNPKNDFTELVKKNFIKGAKGKFGSTVQRFKDANTTATEDDSQFRMTDSLILQCTLDKSTKNDIKKINRFSNNSRYFKKSMTQAKTKKKLEMLSKEQDNRPLIYDTEFYTISQKVSKRKQIQAPFLVASERFTDNYVEYEDYLANVILEDEKNIVVNGIGQNKKFGKMKGKIHRGTPESTSLYKKYQSMKENKMCEKQKVEKPLGPQTYDPQPMGKKSFNTLFQSQQ